MKCPVSACCSWSLWVCCDAGECFAVDDLELQRQVVYSLNSVLYEQLQYKGNEFDYYNPLNSYIHQVGCGSDSSHRRCVLFSFFF